MTNATITTPGSDSIQRDEAGRMLLNVNDLARAGAAGNYTRYNGGWVKKVDALDKRRANGYSLLGDFVQGTTYLQPGIYLDCSIAGSRKHQRRTYTLFRLTPSGEVEPLATVGDTRDWAVRLWPALEAAGVQEYRPVSSAPSAKRTLSADEVEAFARQLRALDAESFERVIRRFQELEFE